jgi:Antitoxin Phd_YefM, type II toxin-antitoxin system
MKAIMATAARKRFGALLDAIQHGPVLIRRKNGDPWVVISVEEYARIHGSKGVDPKRETIDPKNRRFVEAR